VKHVPVGELDAVWHLVVHGIRVVREKCKERWNEDDVRRQLNSDQARLYVRSEGFVILQQSQEAWSGLPCVNVWVAWFKPQQGKGIKHEVVEFLDQFGLWKFESPRMGWAAELEDYMQVERVIYRRKK
jgi:hypothetical protein